MVARDKGKEYDEDMNQVENCSTVKFRYNSWRRLRPYTRVGVIPGSNSDCGQVGRSDIPKIPQIVENFWKFKTPCYFFSSNLLRFNLWRFKTIHLAELLIYKFAYPKSCLTKGRGTVVSWVACCMQGLANSCTCGAIRHTHCTHTSSGARGGDKSPPVVFSQGIHLETCRGNILIWFLFGWCSLFGHMDYR